MNFLKEIRDHLEVYESEFKDEIHKFIDFLHTKYQHPSAPIVADPVVSYVQQNTPTYTPAVDNSTDTSSPEPISGSFDVVGEPVTGVVSESPTQNNTDPADSVSPVSVIAKRIKEWIR